MFIQNVSRITAAEAAISLTRKYVHHNVLCYFEYGGDLVSGSRGIPRIYCI
jgi:hypothetical protein